MTRETPDLVSRIFDQGGPEEVTTLFSVGGDLAESRELIRIARDFYFAFSPVDEWVYFFQPGEPKNELRFLRYESNRL